MENFPEFRKKRTALRDTPQFSKVIYVSGISVSLDTAPGISGNFDCTVCISKIQQLVDHLEIFSGNFCTIFVSSKVAKL